MHKVAGQASAQRAVVDSPFAAGQRNIWTQIIDQNKKEAKEKGGARASESVRRTLPPFNGEPSRSPTAPAPLPTRRRAHASGASFSSTPLQPTEELALSPPPSRGWVRRPSPPRCRPLRRRVQGIGQDHPREPVPVS